VRLKARLAYFVAVLAVGVACTTDALNLGVLLLTGRARLALLSIWADLHGTAVHALAVVGRCISPWRASRARSCSSTCGLVRRARVAPRFGCVRLCPFRTRAVAAAAARRLRVSARRAAFTVCRVFVRLLAIRTPRTPHFAVGRGHIVRGGADAHRAAFGTVGLALGGFVLRGTWRSGEAGIRRLWGLLARISSVLVCALARELPTFFVWRARAVFSTGIGPFLANFAGTGAKMAAAVRSALRSRPLAYAFLVAGFRLRSTAIPVPALCHSSARVSSSAQQQYKLMRGRLGGIGHLRTVAFAVVVKGFAAFVRAGFNKRFTHHFLRGFI
jgi:hypothetical protein